MPQSAIGRHRGRQAGWHGKCLAEVKPLPARASGGTPRYLVPAADERPAMTKYKLEYIWLDGYTPTPNLRGKTQIKEFAEFPTIVNWK